MCTPGYDTVPYAEMVRGQWEEVAEGEVAEEEYYSVTVKNLSDDVNTGILQEVRFNQIGEVQGSFVLSWCSGI